MPTDRALEELCAEGQELVEALHRELLSLDEELAAGRAAGDRLGVVVRNVHTLKGMASLLGSSPMVGLSHRLEDLLGILRADRLTVSPPVVDLLFEAVDGYERFFGGDLDGRVIEALAERVERVTSTAGAGDPHVPDRLDAAILSVLLPGERDRLHALQRAGQGIWRVGAIFALASAERDLEDLRARLRDVGEIVTCMAASRAVPEGSIGLDVIVAARSGHALEVLAAQLGVRATRLFEPSAADSAAPVAVPADAAGETTRTIGGSVRVDVRRIDAALATLAELRAHLSGAADGVSERLVALERNLLEMRMVPLTQLFEKLARLVRALAREVDKDLVLEIQGAETPLDKVLVEELSEPLLHILRNAVDHGIEPEAERLAAGKPTTGTLRIRAGQKKDRVVIEVSDDGRGLDERLLVDTAVRRGLVRATATAAFTRAEILNLIFLSGFSTRETPTALSGRGVGLEVVRNHVVRISGILDVATTPGKGTRFTISLPSTLAVTRALLVTIADRLYAIPHQTVLDAHLLVAVDTRSVNGREIAQVTGREVPLLRLDRHLHLDRIDAPAREWIVVVGLAEKRLALVVDDLAGVEDVVLSGAGTAARRGHEVVLALDVARLLHGGKPDEAAA